MLKAGLVAGALIAGAVAAPAIAADGGSWPGDPDVPRTTVYDVGGAAETLLSAENGLRCAEDNAFRQAPGDGAALCGDGDQDLASVGESRFWDGETTHNFGLHRALGKVNASELARLRTAPQIAARIQREIDSPKAQANSGQVGIDEIGNAFRDPKTRVQRRAFRCNGQTVGRFPVDFTVRCSVNGWKLVKSPIQPDPPPPGSPASDLAGAMEILDGIPHPNGGTYAERVHMYMAPAFVTSIAAGRGAHFTQGRSGNKPIRPGWQGVARAAALAGGVHVEMYHRPGVSVSGKTWRLGPTRIASYLRRFGGSPDRVHLMLSRADSRPRGASCDASDPMVCQVELARRGRNAQLLANGPTLFRLGGQASVFLAAYRAAQA